mmetsp:Transcript_64167/g.93941  ORF Transcript_64167/g.93941 Transcript_64167/m.93941 type:complete len:223 (-) Transcript_64167:589-1257(-)
MTGKTLLHTKAAHTVRRDMRPIPCSPLCLRTIVVVQRRLIHKYVVRPGAHFHHHSQGALIPGILLIHYGVGIRLSIRNVEGPLAVAQVACLVLGICCSSGFETATESAANLRWQSVNADSPHLTAPAHRTPHVAIQTLPRQCRHVERMPARQLHAAVARSVHHPAGGQPQQVILTDLRGIFVEYVAVSVWQQLSLHPPIWTVPSGRVHCHQHARSLMQPSCD